MFSLTVNQRGLEAHAAFRNLIQVVEQNGVMHQGLGPGVARVVTNGVSNALTLLCELNINPGHAPDGHLASLAHAADDPATQLTSILQDWKHHHPNVTLAIGQEALAAHFKYGRALTPQGVYMAAGTWQQGTLFEAHSGQMGLHTPIPLRSISKALVCVVMLVLQDRGLLDIDQPLSAYLPEWNSSPDKAAITLKQIMCHTSGLPNNMSDLLSVIQDPHISLAESSRRMAQQHLQYPAGEFHYNNPAYNNLGAVAEHVSNSSWHEVFQDTVAEPLGMKNTYFVNVFSDEVSPSNPSLGMGGVSTAADMLNFMTMIMNKGTVPHSALQHITSSSSSGDRDNSSSSRRHVPSEAAVELLMKSHAAKAAGSVDAVWDSLAAPEDGSLPEKVQLQIDAGLIPQPAVEWGLLQWAKPQYALGSWVMRHRVTGKRSITWVSSYNSYLSVDDVEGDDPSWVMYMSHSHTPQAPGCRVGNMMQQALATALAETDK